MSSRRPRRYRASAARRPEASSSRSSSIRSTASWYTPWASLWRKELGDSQLVPVCTPFSCPGRWAPGKFFPRAPGPGSSLPIQPERPGVCWKAPHTRRLQKPQRPSLTLIPRPSLPMHPPTVPCGNHFAAGGGRCGLDTSQPCLSFPFCRNGTRMLALQGSGVCCRQS